MNIYKSAVFLYATVFSCCGLSAAINIGIDRGTWEIGAGASGSWESSPFQIQNNGEPVRVNVRASNSANWQLSNIARMNAFAIEWGDAGVWKSLSGSDEVMFPSLASGVSQPFSLKYHSPTYTIPLVNNIPQVSSITLTAVSTYMGAVWNAHSAALAGYREGGSVAMDAAGEFHVAYASSTYLPTGEFVSGVLLYSDWNGVPAVVSTDILSGSNINLAIDGNGRPHIVYVSKAGELKYAWFNVGAWSINIVASGLDTSSPWGFSLSMDGTNLPHIAYADFAKNGPLIYASFNGSEWISENVVDNPGVWMMTLNIDTYGNPTIAYDSDGGVGTASKDKITGVWTKKIIIPSKSLYSGFVIDSQKKLYLTARHDVLVNSQWEPVREVYKKNDDGNWVFVCKVVTDATLTYLSMSVDPGGYPRIVYWEDPDNDSGWVLHYDRWTGTEWLRSDIAVGANIINFNHIVSSGFDLNGVPIVGYVSADHARGEATFGYARLE